MEELSWATGRTEVQSSKNLTTPQSYGWGKIMKMHENADKLPRKFGNLLEWFCVNSWSVTFIWLGFGHKGPLARWSDPKNKSMPACQKVLITYMGLLKVMFDFVPYKKVLLELIFTFSRPAFQANPSLEILRSSLGVVTSGTWQMGCIIGVFAVLCFTKSAGVVDALKWGKTDLHGRTCISDLKAAEL